jgi:excisionase family DNA binding protein
VWANLRAESRPGGAPSETGPRDRLKTFWRAGKADFVNPPASGMIDETRWGCQNDFVNTPTCGMIVARSEVENLSVAQASSLLGIDGSRVRQLLRAGTLAGRRVGRDWLVSADGVAALRERPGLPGRPLAPRRAWALLDLLDGGEAAWLAPVARSQVRAHLRRLEGAGAAAWRNALRARDERHPMSAHRAALARLISSEGVWPAGASAASAAGADLVAYDPVTEVYIPAEIWGSLAGSLRLAPATDKPDVLVRVPRELWPFGPGGPGQAALAATLLDSDEWRATQAGREILNALAGATRR